MMKIHPREKVIRDAKHELSQWEEKHGLTNAEVIAIFSATLASMAKYMIRDERHGDTDKEGGLE